jgi:hypothetical protein|tara:strand:- start:470 stop:595 length:126 start_codon:yes stop_codon:yes gene_type:complete
MKKFLLTLSIVLFGVGCKSLPGNLEIDTPFFDIEYQGTKTE